MLNSNLTVENEPVKKKQRFANLETSELDVLLDSAQSQSTKYNISFAVSVYKGKLTKKMFITRKCSVSIPKFQLNSMKFKGNSNFICSQNRPSKKMLKNHYTNKVARNLTRTYEHFMPRPETKKAKNTESRHYCV